MSVERAQGSRTPDAKARLRLWLRLLKVGRHVEGRLRENLRTEFDTTLPRFDVLAALYRHADGLKMSELSRLLIVSNGNVTGIIDRLVNEGLVLRVAVPGDRRASLVRLTKKGEGTFLRQAEAHERWIDGLLDGIPAEEALTISRGLERLGKKLEAERSNHGG
ncbi:MAG: MarR family transcriptional regulator [Pseudomonadota bacterium]